MTMNQKASETNDDLSNYHEVSDSEEDESASENPVKPNEGGTLNHNENSSTSARNVKIIFVLVIVMSLVGAIAIFFYIKNSEKKKFHLAFNDDANKVGISILFHNKVVRGYISQIIRLNRSTSEGDVIDWDSS
jgi:hypothetical protein